MLSHPGSQWKGLMWEQTGDETQMIARLKSCPETPFFFLLFVFIFKKTQNQPSPKTKQKQKPLYTVAFETWSL